DGDGDGVAPVAARAEAQRLAPVTADRPFLSKPGLAGRIRGAILVPVKWVLRKMMRWYVEPLAADQRAFNSSVLTLADSLTARIETVRQDAQALMGPIAEVRAETDRLSTVAAEHDDRLVRVERRPAAPARQRHQPVSVTPPPEPEHPFDYFAFES